MKFKKDDPNIICGTVLLAFCIFILILDAIFLN